MKGFRNTTRTQVGHSFARGGSVGGVADFSGSALVRRTNPVTEEAREAGGRSPLQPGYAKGGPAKHFHVHKHYHEGGKIRTETKSYRKHEKEMERRAEGGQPKKFIQKAIKHPGRLHEITHTPKGQKIPMAKIKKAEHSSSASVARAARLGETLKGMHHKATGGTVNKLNAGGALYASGGATGLPMPGAALGTLGRLAAAPRVPMRKTMPMPGPRGVLGRAGGGSINATEARSIAKRAVGEHIAYPAPQGHKGLGKMLGKSR